MQQVTQEQVNNAARKYFNKDKLVSVSIGSFKGKRLRRNMEMFGKKKINKSRAWKRLEHHYKSMRKVEMRDMFRKDPQRAERYSINLEGLTLDYSKTVSMTVP